MRSSCCLRALIILTLLLVGNLTTVTPAQTPRFGAFQIPALEGVYHVRAHAINKRAEVVGEITFSVNGAPHAFLYLPQSRGGLAAGMHDLHDLADLSGDHSIAYDINDFMQIVGEVNGVAHIWDMVGYVIEHEDWSRSLGTLGGGSSVAYAISTANDPNDPFPPTPIIVGESLLGSGSNCPSPGGARTAGFAVEYDLDESITLIQLNSSRTNQHTRSRDVQSVHQGRAVGFSQQCPETIQPECDYRWEALSWLASASYSITDMESIPDSGSSDDYEAEALCINRNGQASGWCGELDTGQNCVKRIYFWSSVGASPVDLHSTFFGIGDETQGNAIRDQEASGRIQIVGFEDRLDDAYIWERISGTWYNYELLDLIDSVPAHCGVDKFLTATDINELGQITVIGEVPDDPEHPELDDMRRSWILSSREGCSADIVPEPYSCADGRVDVHDLFLLLANWNTDGAGAELAAPTNVVDVNDLFYLLGHWGFCNAEPGTLLETEEDCFEKFPLTEIEALIACLEAVHGIGE